MLGHREAVVVFVRALPDGDSVACDEVDDSYAFHRVAVLGLALHPHGVAVVELVVLPVVAVCRGCAIIAVAVTIDVDRQLIGERRGYRGVFADIEAVGVIAIPAVIRINRRTVDSQRLKVVAAGRRYRDSDQLVVYVFLIGYSIVGLRYSYAAVFASGSCNAVFCHLERRGNGDVTVGHGEGIRASSKSYPSRREPIQLIARIGIDMDRDGFASRS